MSVIHTGKPIRRLEDPRLLTGRGRYVADIAPPGTLHAAILRSPHAHACIRRIETARAAALPGVVAVFTASDLGSYNRPLPNRFPHPTMRYYPPRPLADGKVRFVGEPVAMVVAESRYVAEDALDQITVEYDPLPAVVNIESALVPSTPVIHEDQGAPDNLAARFIEQYGDVEAAFARAHRVVRLRLTIGRCAGIPMECRGILASIDELGRLVVWNATQAPHMIRDILADLLDLGPHEVRVIPPDVGGAFGVKEPFYPEDFLIPFAARRLRRSVLWVEDRRENLMAGVQERGQIHEAELAVDADGSLLGLRDRFVADAGAYCLWGIVVPVITATMMPGAYRLPAFRCEGLVVHTNTCPTAPYRGAGRPQAVFVMERLLHEAARVLGMDPIQIRRRNLIPPEAFPYPVGLVGRDGAPLVYDSGNYPACLEKLLELIDYEGFLREQEAARAQGRRLGIGFAFGVENCGLGPFEGARVRIDPRGRVVIYTGACSQGQGHATTLAQVAADVLGVTPDQVDLIGGDTDGIPYGTGTFASRTAVNAGNAVLLACRQVREQVLRLAAHMLETSPEDLDLEGGEVRVKGVPDRKVTLRQLAAFASIPFPGQVVPKGVSVGLEATEYFAPPAATFSSGVHAAVVEVEPELGIVRVLRYAIVHDCGNILNPLLVEGQVIGGWVAGLGNALLEEVIYNPDGQLLTATFMDYLIPTALDVPPVQFGHICTPSPHNPLGVKGVGENGTIPVPACINNAIADALGLAVNETPITPPKLRALLRGRASGEV